MSGDAAGAGAPVIGTAHRRRLRALWRSAGWPSQDLLEVDLLVAGLVERQRDAAGRDTLRLTDAGLRELAASHQGHRRARDGHEALVARVALDMHRNGRLVWRGLTLRAPVPAALRMPVAPPSPSAGAPVGGPMLPASPPPGLFEAIEADPAPAAAEAVRWVLAMPDVYAIRPSTREDQVLPVAHEVKVRRADLLADLRRPAKGEAYRALASECWYVLHAGIGHADEIPSAYGVMQAHPLPGSDGPAYGVLEVLRPAPRRPYVPPLAVWLALARAAPERFDEADLGAAELPAAEDDRPEDGPVDGVVR